jgi:hypothetical protein
MREQFGRKATSNDRRVNVRRSLCSKHVRRSVFYGLVITAGNKLEEMLCKGDPLTESVKVGERRVLAIVQVTCFVALGHEALFSVPQSVALAAGTIVHADVLREQRNQ